MTRTAVITGGASGLGEACARRFAADGVLVWILDANAERAAAVAADVGGAARSAAVDVTDEAALVACAERIRGETGSPDILVTSAGILETVATVMDEDMDVHDRVWAVNYRGTVATCRAFGRLMRAAGRGAIVTLGSTNSFSALPLPAYGPSKTAIVRLTQILAVELGRHGVRVNGVAPTYVITPAMQARIDFGRARPRRHPRFRRARHAGAPRERRRCGGVPLLGRRRGDHRGHAARRCRLCRGGNLQELRRRRALEGVTRLAPDRLGPVPGNMLSMPRMLRDTCRWTSKPRSPATTPGPT